VTNGKDENLWKTLKKKLMSRSNSRLGLKAHFLEGKYGDDSQLDLIQEEK
jgi:hypothetical protein